MVDEATSVAQRTSLRRTVYGMGERRRILESIARWIIVEEPRGEGLKCVHAAGERKRVAASIGRTPNSEVGSYMFGTMGNAPKLVTVWMVCGVWRWSGL